ncbi:hypothetical protein SADUNF_Sadunf04G0027500 [Salix dunnii]|uniref:Zinc finger LSD1-type domain-containing protein n=1 Tax=Salix dunnii TaxID=1413687 RepID=A0A835N061_9ROSI|nr:hypothetical protein SADUNF_Sadunf04G0027500 [Salix dunnii]
MASKEEDMAEAEEEEEGPPPGWQSFPPQPSLPPPSTPPPPSSVEHYLHAELGQMVCGSCRRLLSYPKGARHVQCQCCQMINFVLEAHEVGQVKCGSCDVLLMYPYGASSVRCSSCRFVTEIGEQNRRPPWSVIQGYPPRPMSFNPIS